MRRLLPFAVLLLAACARVKPSPAPTITAPQGDPAAFHCEPGLDSHSYGGVRCTAFSIGELTPTWRTYHVPYKAGDPPAFVVSDVSALLPLDREWMLIEMTVGRPALVLAVWARKSSPTGVIEYKNFHADEKEPAR